MQQIFTVLKQLLVLKSADESGSSVEPSESNVFLQPYMSHFFGPAQTEATLINTSQLT